MHRAAAARPDSAPTPSDHRGPHVSDTQPAMGAPIGVPPRVTASRMAMTLPRMAWSVVSWIRLLAVVVSVCEATPTATRTRANNQKVGAMAASPSPIPKTAEPASSRARRGRDRRAASRAPITDPTAITEVSTP